MKGFGMESSKQQIMKAIKMQDEKKLLEQVDKLLYKYGREKTKEWFVNEILPIIEPKSVAWALETIGGEEHYEKVREKVAEAMVQILEEKGFELGKDFSRHEEDGFYLTEECSEALLEIVPEEDREEVRKEVLGKERVVDAQVALEKHLGVPFVNNVLSRMEVRIPEMSDTVAGFYLVCMGCGVQDRTGIDLFPILLEHLGESYPERIKPIWEAIVNLEAMREVPVNIREKALPKVVLDLVIAAGGEKELRPNPIKSDEFLISLSGTKILASVYQGENSLYSLIGAMAAHERKLREQRRDDNEHRL